MDSAGALNLQGLLENNNAQLDRQEEQMLVAGRAVQALVAQVSELTTQLQQLRMPTAPLPPPVHPAPLTSATQREPRLPAPETYNGEPNLCRAFLVKCSMFFALQPQTFATEESKVTLFLTLLSGKAALWETAVWENHHACCSSFHALSEEMKRVFDRAVVGREAARRLADLRQGERSVSDFSIEFRTLAAEEAQWDMFLHGLADRIQREIFARELPTSLDGLIDLSLRVDSQLQQRDQRACHQPWSPIPDYSPVEPGRTVSHLSDSEPMQVGRARLSQVERERRRARGLCLYCGASGHFLDECPVNAQARQ